MQVRDVFEHLMHGELSQLKVGSGANGEILDENHEKLLPHLNLGLTALYTRFHLKSGSLKLSLVPGQVAYPLHSKYAVSNVASSEPVKYIVDTVSNPFMDDVLKIERVKTDPGYYLAINDEDEPYSVHTPSPRTLAVPLSIIDKGADLPDVLKTDFLELTYRANHPRLTLYDNGYLPDQEVELPDTHLEALLLYIGSRVHTPAGMTNEFHAGNSYYAKYLAACADLETKNFQIDQGTGNTKLQRGGWV